MCASIACCRVCVEVRLCVLKSLVSGSVHGASSACCRECVVLRSLVAGSMWYFDRLLPGVCGASIACCQECVVLRSLVAGSVHGASIACCRVWVDGFDSSKESFSPRVSVQCRLFCGVRTVAVCKRMHQHLRAREKSQTRADIMIPLQKYCTQWVALLLRLL